MFVGGTGWGHFDLQGRRDRTIERTHRGPGVGHDGGEGQRDAGGDEEDGGGLGRPEEVLAGAGAVCGHMCEFVCI